MTEIPIVIEVGEKYIFSGVLWDTNLGTRIKDILPLEEKAETWGEELYMPVAVNSEIENGQVVMEKGDLAYWPTMPAFCLFYGPTPASRDDKEIRAAGHVEVVGKFTGDFSLLKELQGPVKIKISLEE